MKKVAFLLGSVHVGGGTYVVFQHALYLVRAGFEVTVVTEDEVTPAALAWHPEAQRELSFKTFSQVQSTSFDLAVATWWKTVFSLHRVEARSYVYFVQSIESRFYTESDLAARKFVESTYCLGLPVITEARWIQEYLQREFGARVALAPNGIRKDLYTEQGAAISPRERGKLRVLVEGPLGVFFKNTERTIELCSQSKADEIWFLTSSPGCVEYPWVDRIFSCVPITETPAIYRSCDLIVKLSYVEGMFGPPLEMFHCGGTAIVYDVTGHDEYVVNGRNAIVIPRDNEEQVIQTINRLRDDTAGLESLKDGARTTSATWPDWTAASKVFADGLLSFSGAQSPVRGALQAAARVFSEWHAAHSGCQATIAELRHSQRALESAHSSAQREVEIYKSYKSKLDLILGSRSFRAMQAVRSTRGVKSVKKAVEALGRLVR
jgi:hypothetical protein